MMSNPVKNVDRIFYAARHDHMADDKTFFQHAAFIILNRTYLSEHFQNGGGGCLWIIRSIGVAQGSFTVQIFQIRQININITLQHTQCIHRFITGGIINYRDLQFPTD